MNPYDVATGSALTIFIYCFYQGMKYYATPVFLWYHRTQRDGNPEYREYWAGRGEEDLDVGAIWSCMAPLGKNDHPKKTELNREFVALVAPYTKNPWIRKVAADWLKNQVKEGDRGIS